MSPANWDNFAILYNGTFTPATPLVNAVAYNDEFPGAAFATTAGVTYNVTAGVTYTFVTTSY